MKRLLKFLNKLGLTWAPLKEVKHTFTYHIKKKSKHFLIKLDKIIRVFEEGGWFVHKRTVDCSVLWSICLKYARTIDIPVCDGIKVERDSLEVDKNSHRYTCELPKDIIMIYLKRLKPIDEYISCIEYIWWSYHYLILCSRWFISSV